LDIGFSLAAREKENVSTHGRGRGYGLPAKTMHEKELTDVKRGQNESFFNDSIIMSPNRSSRGLRQTYSKIVVPTRPSVTPQASVRLAGQFLFSAGAVFFSHKISA